jgi:hypothetical protein
MIVTYSNMSSIVKKIKSLTPRDLTAWPSENWPGHKDPNPSRCDDVRTFLNFFFLFAKADVYTAVLCFLSPVTKHFLAFTKG